MRLIFTILFILVGISATAGRVHPHFLEYKEGQRYFLAPGRDGKLVIVDIEATDDGIRFTAESDVRFLLYTRSNPTTAYQLINGDSSSLSGSNFAKTKPVKIISHGWNSDGTSNVNTLIRNAYLGQMDVNVIVIDWGKGANVLYGSAVKNVPKVAKWVAKLVDWLVDEGVSLKNFHIMGHSLGGHIAGQSARAITKGKIPYVTAFDPAGPSWGPGTDRVTTGDADYVEVIHTNAGNLGIKEPIGDNDFYPNEGFGMPGCTIINIGCSHSRSYEYFADSIDHRQFMANQCENVNEALNDKCSNLSVLHMGGANPKDARGVFHLKTNSKLPYYMG